MFVNYSYVFTRYDKGVNGGKVPAYFWIELAFLCHPLVKKTAKPTSTNTTHKGVLCILK